MKTFCFDIDDTILFSEIMDVSTLQAFLLCFFNNLLTFFSFPPFRRRYIARDSNYKLTSEDQEMINIINHLYEDGNQIVIQTGRHWNHLNITKKQLRNHGIKYHTLVMGNVVADYYINDKGIKPEDFKDEYKRSL